MVPVVLGGNFLDAIITVLQFLRLQKFLNRFFGAASAKQFVSVHVMGMRDRGSQTRVGGG